VSTRIRHFVVGLLVLLLCATGSGVVVAASTLRLATTTSTENSGLLARLLPPFEQANHVTIHVIAVGTGKALELGRRGDVDVLMVHAKKSELAFVAGGYGVDREEFMYNDFLIVGPADDPAGIGGGGDPLSALLTIAEHNALFVSRGDDSGTHKRELSLWRSAAAQSKGAGYREVGQGMGRTLQLADEMGAYTLVDRGTWLALRDKLQLRPMVEGAATLRNVYGVIAVNPARFPDTQYGLARRFIDWLRGEQALGIIAGYQLDGQPLFHPILPPQRLAAPRPALVAEPGPQG